ncbi:hypothetical protein J6590_098438 [Homalodisca vitripennis]|nr:hypothetical protein J6590_098438 [Homalodisca vitripennis]
MVPPENHLNSDEDSGEEENMDINHLRGCQLRAPGEVKITRITESGVEELFLGCNEDHIDCQENTNQGDQNTARPATGDDFTLDTRPVSQLFDISLPSTSCDSGSNNHNSTKNPSLDLTPKSKKGSSRPISKLIKQPNQKKTNNRPIVKNKKEPGELQIYRLTVA